MAAYAARRGQRLRPGLGAVQAGHDRGAGEGPCTGVRGRVARGPCGWLRRVGVAAIRCADKQRPRNRRWMRCRPRLDSFSVSSSCDPVRYEGIVAGQRPRKAPPTPQSTRGKPASRVPLPLPRRVFLGAALGGPGPWPGNRARPCLRPASGPHASFLTPRRSRHSIAYGNGARASSAIDN